MFFLIFYNFLYVHLHMFNFLMDPDIFFETIHSYSSSSWIRFSYLVTLFLNVLLYAQVSLEYFRHLVIEIFCPM